MNILPQILVAFRHYPRPKRFQLEKRKSVREVYDTSARAALHCIPADYKEKKVVNYKASQYKF